MSSLNSLGDVTRWQFILLTLVPIVLIMLASAVNFVVHYVYFSLKTTKYTYGGAIVIGIAYTYFLLFYIFQVVHRILKRCSIEYPFKPVWIKLPTEIAAVLIISLAIVNACIVWDKNEYVLILDVYIYLNVHCY